MKLHVEGRYIKNSLGQTIALRGVNYEGMLDDSNGWWNPEGATSYYAGLRVWNPDAVKYNLNKMREWGANCLRLLIKIQWWIDDTNSYRQHIKDIITWAGERGLYVVFCPYMVVTGDSCFKPPWTSTNPSDLAYIPDSQAFMNFYANVANELKGFPNVLFEVYNEAWMGNVETQQWIDTVRATGAQQLLTVQYYSSMGVNFWRPLGPTEWVKGMEWVETVPINDPLGNIVYSFHLYRGGIHSYDGNLTREDCYKYDDLKHGFQLAKVDYVVNTLNKPVYVGEIGANMWETGTALEEELAFFENCLTIFNEWGLSYTAWIWTYIAHLRHGLLQTVLPWLPPPNDAGQILINSMVTPPIGPTTPFLSLLEEAVYLINMPPTVTTPTPTGNVTYAFKQWEDGSTNPARTINLTAYTAITATYELVEAPPTPPIAIIPVVPATAGLILTGIALS